MLDAINDLVGVGSNASFRCGQSCGLEVSHDRTFLLGNKAAHHLSSVESVLLCLLGHVGCARQILVDGEGELTSVHWTVFNRSIFSVVVYLCLTDRRDRELVTIRETFEHLDVALSHHLVAQDFFEFGGPNLRAGQQTHVCSCVSHYSLLEFC